MNNEPHIKCWNTDNPDPVYIEFMALIWAINELPDGASAVIYCDNQAVVALMNSDYSNHVMHPEQYIAKDEAEWKQLHIMVKWIPGDYNYADKYTKNK